MLCKRYGIFCQEIERLNTLSGFFPLGTIPSTKETVHFIYLVGGSEGWIDRLQIDTSSFGHVTFLDVVFS